MLAVHLARYNGKKYGGRMEWQFRLWVWHLIWDATWRTDGDGRSKTWTKEWRR